jgi:hypothetical protein
MKLWNRIDRIVSGQPSKPLLLAFFLAFALFFPQPVNAQKDANSTYLLIGMIGGKSLSGAVLQDSTGEQLFYRLYDKLPDGSQIVKLRDDGISLKDENGLVYEMFISHDTKTAASESGTNGKSYASESAPIQHRFTQAEQESIARQKQRQQQLLNARQRANKLDE